MKIKKTEICCTIDVDRKGEVYLKYSQYRGFEPLVEFEANSIDLVQKGRIPGKTYCFCPKKNRSLNDPEPRLGDVLSVYAMKILRNSAKDLPDKLRAGLEL